MSLEAHIDMAMSLATMTTPVVVHRRIDPIVRRVAPRWFNARAAAKQKAIFLSLLGHIRDHERLAGINSVVRG